MTVLLEVGSARSASLTATQLATLQRLWHLAGLPPVSGYGTVALAMMVASAPTLADMLSSIDFDDSDSTACAVDALLEWRQRFVQVTP